MTGRNDGKCGMRITCGSFARTIFGHALIVCLIICIAIIAAIFVKPPEVNAATKETYANVVIFAYFQDGNDSDYYIANPNQYITYEYYKSLKDDEFYQDEKVADAFKKMYDGDQPYSMKNYMSTVSDGKFEVVNLFPQVKDGVITPYCIKNTKLADAKTGNIDEAVIGEIMKNVILPSDMTVDYNEDGCVDNLTVILRGGGVGVGSTGGKGAPTLYAHKADYGDITTKWSNTGKAINAYNMLNTYSIMESLGSSEAGVLAHEFMHTIGFPDLYPQDGAEEGYPVYSWDIMASSARYQSYPLMYMRMKVAKWVDESEIPVITQSKQSVTLKPASDSSGTRACIIRSPLNNEQFFVVEFRKKAQNDDIDRYIGGSGIIVYRIDPTVDELSNHGGRTAVYVFRPQSGNGYDEANPRTTVLNAYLSEESGRTTIGSDDINKTLQDGALTYTNGDNSGIVISNVSSAEGDEITFDVSVPDAGAYDTWTDTQFEDTASESDWNKKVVIRSWNGTPYMAVYRDGKISLWKHEDSTWKSVGTEITCSYLNSLNLEVYNDNLYLSYDKNGDTICIQKMSRGSTTWLSVGQTGGSEHSLKAMNDGLYMAYLKADSSGWNSTAILASISGDSIKTLKEYDSGLIGTPQLASASGEIYVSVRNASNNNAINIYKYINGSMKLISDGNLSANTYDMTGNGDRIYVVLGGSTKKLELHTYDGTQWETVASEMECFQPKLSTSQGNLYVLMTPSEQGSIKVIRYDEESKSFVEEGVNIDGAPASIDFTAIDHKLYVGYVRQSDMKIYVKLKESTAPDTGGDSGSGGGGSTGETAGSSGESGTGETGGTAETNKSHKIVPKGTTIRKLKPAKKSITVHWKKQKTQTTGYQIQYSTKSKFRGAKTITIKKNTVSKKTIKKLRSKKKYYIRVRTYKRVAGKTYYSSWSKAKRAKTK